MILSIPRPASCIALSILAILAGGCATSRPWLDAAPSSVPDTPTQMDRLYPGQGLTMNQSLSSEDKHFRLIMQGDGNLVQYREVGYPTWCSQTYHQGAMPDAVTMQQDGNLVIYDTQGRPLWSSKTWGNPGAWLQVENDGIAVIYGTNGQVLWKSSAAAT